MKTKTIDFLIKRIETVLDARDIVRYVDCLLDLRRQMQSEKKRKELKQLDNKQSEFKKILKDAAKNADIRNLCLTTIGSSAQVWLENAGKKELDNAKAEISRLNKIIEMYKPFESIENTAHDEIYQRGFEDGKRLSHEEKLLEEYKSTKLSERIKVSESSFKPCSVMDIACKMATLSVEMSAIKAETLKQVYKINGTEQFGFSITPTGKVIINNGELFKPFLDKLNEAYLRQNESVDETTLAICSKNGVTIRDLKQLINACNDDYFVAVLDDKNGLARRVKVAKVTNTRDLKTNEKVNVLGLIPFD